MTKLYSFYENSSIILSFIQQRSVAMILQIFLVSLIQITGLYASNRDTLIQKPSRHNPYRLGTCFLAETSHFLQPATLSLWEQEKQKEAQDRRDQSDSRSSIDLIQQNSYSLLNPVQQDSGLLEHRRVPDLCAVSTDPFVVQEGENNSEVVQSLYSEPSQRRRVIKPGVIKHVVVGARRPRNNVDGVQGPRVLTTFSRCDKKYLSLDYWRRADSLVLNRSDAEIREMICPGSERVVLEAMLKTFSLNIQKEEIDTLRATLFAVARCLSSQQLNDYQNGQTVAHKLTPVHWVNGIVPYFQCLGLNLTAASKEPDRYVGSTLAHNIAGLCSSPSHRDIVVRQERALKCLAYLWSIDQEHFDWLSQSRFSSTSVWDLLAKADLSEKFKHNYIRVLQK